jgi:hypothetical protein
MQIKKELALFCALILLSVCLLYAAAGPTDDLTQCSIKGTPVKCCQQQQNKLKTESPWNFITRGILHLSA